MKKEITTIASLHASLNSYNGRELPVTVEEFIHGWKQKQREIKREEAILFFESHRNFVESNIKKMISRRKKIKKDSPFEFEKSTKEKEREKVTKHELNKKYHKEYWEGVRDGTIKRGVKYKIIVTSKIGEPLMFDVIYEDDPRYSEAEFKIPC